MELFRCLCFVFVCHTAMSDPCSLVINCLERTLLFPLVYAMFSCAFVTFSYGVLGQWWYLIVSILIFAFFFL